MEKNWFDTLNEALESENLLYSWNCLWPSINYGEIRRYTWNGTAIIIYRETNGRYERPIHYSIN